MHIILSVQIMHTRLAVDMQRRRSHSLIFDDGGLSSIDQRCYQDDGPGVLKRGTWIGDFDELLPRKELSGFSWSSAPPLASLPLGVLGSSVRRQLANCFCA